jgi:hypothetical protein
MQVFKDWAACLRDEGRLTLQVPVFWLGATPSLVDVPDDWFYYLKCDGAHMRLAVGRESGFLYISPAGYEANKDAIIGAWLKTCKQRGHKADPAIFEAHARASFKSIEDRSLRLASRASCTSKKTAAIQASVRKHFGKVSP